MHRSDSVEGSYVSVWGHASVYKNVINHYVKCKFPYKNTSSSQGWSLDQVYGTLHHKMNNPSWVSTMKPCLGSTLGSTCPSTGPAQYWCRYEGRCSGLSGKVLKPLLKILCWETCCCCCCCCCCGVNGKPEEIPEDGGQSLAVDHTGDCSICMESPHWLEGMVIW